MRIDRAPLALVSSSPVAARLAVTVLLASAAPALAVVDQACPDPAGHEDEIVGGEVLIKLTDFPGSAAKEGCVLGYIPAAPEAVMAILRDAAEYDHYMPRVTQSDVAPGDGGAVLNAQVLDLPWPVGDRHFTVRLVEQQSKDGVYTFAFDYVKGSGNIEDTHGRWSIEPWNGGSRVSYLLWTDPGGAIPAWALNRMSRRTLPLVVTALRDRVRERSASSERGGEHAGS